MMAGRAAQGATVQLPLGQLAIVGLGAYAITNPDKFFYTLQKGTQFLLADRPASSDRGSQQPIVIHQVTSSQAGRSLSGYIIQLTVGAGFCWGSYMLLVNVLPEAAKGMLPVTTTVFNRAVVSLGNAVINLKDNLMEQILGLSKKQDDLGDRQNETHSEVLHVKGNIDDLKGDMGKVKDSVNQCRISLAESERRTSYIARGVHLLTRGVSTILSQDDDLLYELLQFNRAGEEFSNSPPLRQQQQPSDSRLTIEQIRDSDACFSPRPNHPEPLVPQTPPEKYSERSLDEVRALLNSVRTTRVAN
jgi:hypothetical protein